MPDLTVLDFAGKRIRFERRGDRVWVSLTDMAKATGKLVADYTRSKAATEFLTEFESIMGIPIMVSNVGGTTETTGTWAIEEVAIDFASWCNVKFRIWVSQQIRTLMTEGTVTIAPDKLSRILDRPDPWKRFYEKDFCDRAFNWFGAQFYWDYVYCVLTPDEVCKVNTLNPPHKGIRADKIHQYLTDDIKIRLTPYIRELVACIDTAPTRQDFEIGYGRHFGGNDQLRIKGL